MRKGQAVQQIFVFMLSVIIIGLILLIGYRSIDSLLTKSCDANVAQFRENLFNLLLENQIYGSRKRVELESPCSPYYYLCFVNQSLLQPNNEDIVLPEDLPFKGLLRSNINSGNKINVYLIGSKFTELGLVENVRTSQPVLCVTSKDTNTFKLLFEGKGSYVLVSQPEK